MAKTTLLGRIGGVIRSQLQSILLKLILDNLNEEADSDDPHNLHGWLLAVLLFASQFWRSILFNLAFAVGIRTATRVNCALQYMAFSKMLRLAAPNDAALGQIVTFISNDMERVYETVVGGIMFTGAPILFTMSLIYAVYLVGPAALLGMLIILLFYPLMVRVHVLPFLAFCHMLTRLIFFFRG